MTDSRRRDLGFVESYMAAMEAAVPGSLHVVTAVTLGGTVDRVLATTAFELVRRRHPLLRARIASAGPTWTLDVVDGPGEVPVVFGDASGPRAWEDVFQDELDTPLPWTEPLWRARVLDVGPGETVVILTMHHCVADGLSHVVVLRGFLEVYDGLVSGAAPERAVVEAPLRDPVERLLARSGTPPRADSAPLPEAARWPCESPAAPGARRSRALFRTVEPVTLAALRRRAADAGTTVTACLVSGLLAAATAVPDGASSIACTVPASVRALGTPPVGDDEVGLYFGDTRLLVDRADVGADHWARARDCAQRYRDQRGSTRGPVDFSAADVARSVEPFVGVVERFPMGFGAVSNVGRIPGSDPAAALRLTRLHAAISATSGSVAIFLTASTVEDHLFLTFTYTEPLLSRATAVLLAETTMATIRESAADVHR